MCFACIILQTGVRGMWFTGTGIWRRRRNANCFAFGDCFERSSIDAAELLNGGSVIKNPCGGSRILSGAIDEKPCGGERI